MQKSKCKIKERRKNSYGHFCAAGFTLVEIIIALAVILTAGIGLLQLASLQTKASIQAWQETRAYFLGDESLEAARIVRDQAWSGIGGLTKETRYYPVIQSGTWALSNSNPGTINGYTRYVIFHQVFRDGNGNIASSGTADNNTVLAQALVSWAIQGGGSQTISLEAYLTNWQKN